MTSPLLAGALLAAAMLLTDRGGSRRRLRRLTRRSAASFQPSWRWRRRRPTRGERRRLPATAGSPEVADLLATCLSVGVGPLEAIETVARSVTGQHATRLGHVASALRLGADHAEAWATQAADDPLAPVARAFSRASATGAPLATTIALAAEEQRRQQRWTAEAAARRAGVLAVGPLVTCFLPAFVLVGVVPVVLSMAGDVVGQLR